MVTLEKPRKTIRQIKNKNGELVSDSDEILDAFHEYYENIYKFNANSENVQKANAQENYFINLILRNKRQSDTENELDDEFITEFEVEQAIEKLNKDSAPGLDGLPSNLYKSQKNTYVPILTKLFNEIIITGSFPESLKHAIIKLIGKKTSSVSLGDFRPISLINTDQKILSHIIAERLKIVLCDLIGTHQGAYLPNRHIHTSTSQSRRCMCRC